MVADFDETVGLIYDAALDPELWPSVLRRITAAGRGRCTLLLVFDPNVSQPMHVLFDEWPGYDEYFAHYAAIDPRNVYGVSQPAGTGFTDYAFISEAEMAHSEFYQDYLAPHDLGYVGAEVLEKNIRSVAGIAIQRSRRQGPFELDELKILDRLRPHLLRALRLQTRYAELDARRWADHTLRDRLPFAVLLVDARGRIVSLNQMASTLLAAGDGLSARHDRLRTTLSSDQTALERLIRDAAATAEGRGTAGGGAMPLHRASLRRPLNALVMPIPARGGNLTLEPTARRPVAALIVTDPEAVPEPPEAAALRRLYGLSRAESGLARALAAGTSVQEYAEEARISTETARWRLKQVFAKTDTRRQADLVRLVLTSAVLGWR